MAIAVDTVSTLATITAAASGTNATGTHVVGASATMVVVFLEWGNTTFPDSNFTSYGTFTLGGQTLTHLASSLKHSGSDSDTFGFVDVYTLQSPPTGSQTLTWTPTYGGGGTAEYASCVSVSYTGALNASPLGTAKTANGQLVSSLTLTDTLATGDLLVGICANGTSVPSMTTGTSDASLNGGSHTGCHNFRVAHNSGSGSISIVWSTDSSDYSCASGVKIVAAAAATKALPFSSSRQQPILRRK